jgi:hypothetical protein
MKRFLFFPLLCWGLAACQSTKSLNKKETHPVAQKTTEGVAGQVWLVRGNQMPNPRNEGPAHPGQPYPTQVYFYEPTTLAQTNRPEFAPLFISVSTRLVATVESDSTGRFQANLPPGQYSVFVRHKDRFFANQFDIRNNIHLVTVDPGKVSPCQILVNSEASY